MRLGGNLGETPAKKLSEGKNLSHCIGSDKLLMRKVTERGRFYSFNSLPDLTIFSQMKLSLE